MARSLVALLAFVLLTGCVSNAAPADEPVPDEPAQASRFVDGAAAEPGTDASTAADSVSVSARTGIACPLSNEGLDDGVSSFSKTQSQAVEGASKQEATIYEECPTAMRWATTRASSEGLFLRMTVEADEDSLCLATFTAAGTAAAVGPLVIGIGKAEYGAGWGMGSTGPSARVQVLGSDSNDVLWGTGGEWAGGSGIGFSGGSWELTFAAQAVAPRDNEVTQGWAAVLGLVCQAPMEVSAIEAGKGAFLFDQASLEGGASAQVMLAGGASVQDQANAELAGEVTHVVAGAFSDQVWRLDLKHPEGTESATVLPLDSAFFEFSGKPGDYTATLDKVDRPVFSAWWLIMAGAAPYDSLAQFV